MVRKKRKIEKDAPYKLGQILLKANLISRKQLEDALKESLKKDEPLGEVLVKNGAITEKDLAEALAKQKNLPFIDLKNYPIETQAAALIPRKLAMKYNVIPISLDEENLLVAVSNPLDVISLDNLQMITGLNIVPVVAEASSIREAIERYLPSEEVTLETVEERDEEVIPAISQSAASKTVNKIIADALSRRASDIHIEPQEKDVLVRYRVDGVLQEIMRLPKKDIYAIVSRIKVMSNLNIAERRKPQDGSFQVKNEGKRVDVRVSVLPSVLGESVSLRLLYRDESLIELGELGMPPHILKKYLSLAMKPTGAILVTGPTGSGKTTTLYATLKVIATPEKKVITIEDPVEYHLPGITQMSINPKTGLTFSSGLRTILRADPDIIMVGEIRDVETAEIAIRASLTGHLVLSTLHTNDAPSALARLMDMGIEPYLVTSSINAILSQRLARKLCPQCKEAYEPEEETLKLLKLPLSKEECPVIYRAKGCNYCGGTGYFGRIGLFELMIITPQIARLALEKKTAEEIGRVAQEEGMTTLLQDGAEKVKNGITSLEEILRVSRH
jgi:type IV pilus assembly protein PilB